jgi:hypothetical protein
VWCGRGGCIVFDAVASAHQAASGERDAAVLSRRATDDEVVDQQLEVSLIGSGAPSAMPGNGRYGDPRVRRKPFRPHNSPADDAQTPGIAEELGADRFTIDYPACDNRHGLKHDVLQFLRVARHALQRKLYAALSKRSTSGLLFNYALECVLYCDAKRADASHKTARDGTCSVLHNTRPLRWRSRNRSALRGPGCCVLAVIPDQRSRTAQSVLSYIANNCELLVWTNRTHAIAWS